MKRVLPLGVCLLLACGGSGSDSTPSGDDASHDSFVAPDDSSPTDDSASGSDTNGATDSTPVDDGSTDVATLGPYPSPPYGNAVGDTFPDLQWQGYVDDAADALATTKTFGPYSMDAVRRSGKRYAFVHVSDYY